MEATPDATLFGLSLHRVLERVLQATRGLFSLNYYSPLIPRRDRTGAGDELVVERDGVSDCHCHCSVVAVVCNPPGCGDVWLLYCCVSCDLHPTIPYGTRVLGLVGVMVGE
jgi:hypothetical protein